MLCDMKLCHTSHIHIWSDVILKSTIWASAGYYTRCLSWRFLDMKIVHFRTSFKTPIITYHTRTICTDTEYNGLFAFLFVCTAKMWIERVKEIWKCIFKLTKLMVQYSIGTLTLQYDVKLWNSGTSTVNAISETNQIIYIHVQTTLTLAFYSGRFINDTNFNCEQLSVISLPEIVLRVFN